MDGVVHSSSADRQAPGAASATGWFWDINGEGTYPPTLVHLHMAYLTNYEIDWMCSPEAKMVCSIVTFQNTGRK